MSIEQILKGATVTAAGSYVLRSPGMREASIAAVVSGAVTGTTPTLQFFLTEVDPSDETTPVGETLATTPLVGAGVAVLSIALDESTTVLVSWAVTGTSPSFAGTSLVAFARPIGQTDTEQSSSYYPDPKDNHSGVSIPLQTDIAGALRIRGPVFTDEGSFRDNFNGSSLVTALTGTVTFTNGSDIVQGVGTSFLTQLDTQQYIRRTADGETFLTAISSVDSDTELTLETPYAGTSGTGGSFSQYLTTTPSGASFTVSGSSVDIVNGLANGAQVAMSRLVDYGPLYVTSRLTCSARIANQTPYFGFQDTIVSPQQTARVLFDPTLASTQVVFRTGVTSGDVQSTTVTLPNAAVTTAANTYQISITGSSATLTINGIVVAQHTNAIPDSYALLQLAYGMGNAAALASSATLTVDTAWVNNTDRVEVGNTFPGEPLYVQLVGKSAAGLPQPSGLKLVPQYGTANQVVTITIASLTNTSARASTAIDNTTTLFEDVLFFVKFTTAAAGTSATGYVNIWGYATVDGTTYPEAITGTNAAVTLSNPPNLVLLAQLTANANNKAYLSGPFSFCRMYGLDRLPSKWGLVLENRSGATLIAGAGNHSITYQGMNGQIALWR